MRSLLYIIYTFQGTGGHYYSLCATAQAMSAKFNVHILNIGKKVSPVISNSSLPYSFITFSGRNFLAVMKGIKSICKEKNIDIVHCFDIPSYLLAVIPVHDLKVPIVLTKCGGPILGMEQYPVVDNFIFYNKKEYELFRNDKRYSDKNLQLIPNRVGLFNCDQNRINGIKKELGLQDKKVILRIGRIAEAYKNTAIQCVKLTKELHKIDNSYYLLLIGNIKDSIVYKNLLDECSGCDYISILTDDKYTFNAKELIDLSYIVVGTGRGFMEACQKGKRMLAPCKNTKYPVVVTSNNFDEILANNISERYIRTEPEDTIDVINSLLSNCFDSKIWFDRYFSIDSAVDRYVSFYETLRPAKVHYTSVLFPLLRLYLSSFSFLRK